MFTVSKGVFEHTLSNPSTLSTPVFPFFIYFYFYFPLFLKSSTYESLNCRQKILRTKIIETPKTTRKSVNTNFVVVVVVVLEKDIHGNYPPLLNLLPITRFF